MRIGYFITHFPYTNALHTTQYTGRYKIGGAEIASYNLATNIGKMGHEVHVFTSSIDAYDSIEKSNNMIRHRYGTCFRIEMGNVSPRIFQEPLKYDMDIVHAHFSTPPAELAALRYARRKKVPFVVTYHGDWQESFGSIIRRTCISAYNRLLLDRLLSAAKAIISPSRSFISQSRFLLKHSQKISVIPNGVNREDFNIPYSKQECRQMLGLENDLMLILFVGNLIMYKGPQFLISAMPRVLENVPNAALVLVGDGPMREGLGRLTARLGVEENVRFTSYVKEREKILYYKASDLFVLPSTMNTESFGIVNLEAMASGLPIVASRIGGIPDVVKNQENGILVRPGDPKTLANAIVRLAQNENMRKKMSANSSRKVCDYSWAKIAEVTERLYTELGKEI